MTVVGATLAAIAYAISISVGEPNLDPVFNTIASIGLVVAAWIWAVVATGLALGVEQLALRVKHSTAFAVSGRAFGAVMGAVLGALALGGLFGVPLLFASTAGAITSLVLVVGLPWLSIASRNRKG